MAKYNTKKLLQAHPTQITTIAEAIKNHFEGEGYEVQVDDLMSGGKDISITKGGVFMAVLGMRSALKVTLTPQAEGVLFDAGVGIFGQQAIPTIITLFFFWPVLLTQIWGLIQQSSLDDKALEIAESCISAPTGQASPLLSTVSTGTKFCTECGSQVDTSAKFCPNCGKRL